VLLKMRNGNFLFTSESVTEGHPDKLCDQVSDAILDELLKQDPQSRVAVETLTTTGLIVVAGEVTTKGHVDVQDLVRSVVRDIGYNKPEYGFDSDQCSVLVSLHGQSPDISQGVTEGEGLHKEQGAGDQGSVFGYACTETEELMPLPIHLAHKLTERLAEARKKGEIKWLRPDGKSQVTIEYENGKPKRADTIVVSTQHAPNVSYDEIRDTIISKIINPICNKWTDADTKYYVNPTGKFVIGGPPGDTGLTGRKIIVDSYGGYIPHGGGAFSGKDASKVDRSAAYMARYIAKNIVAAGLAESCEIQLAYAIGVADPVSVYINTYGTGKISDPEILKLVRKHFKLKPKEIIDELNLLRPIFRKTSCYGHFGRNDKDFTWENTDKAEILREAAGLLALKEVVR